MAVKSIRLKLPANWFNKHWVCGVVRSGYHNGVHCNPNEPHDPYWRCGYRYELSFSAADWAKLTGEEE